MKTDKTYLDQFYWFTENLSIRFIFLMENKKNQKQKNHAINWKTSDKLKILVGLLFSIQNPNFE